MPEPARPPAYTHGHHDSVLRAHRWRNATNSAAYLLPHLVPGQRLLDVGCGPGTLTIELARRLAPGEVVGIDTSPAVVDEACRAAAGSEVAAFVSFAVADLYTIDQSSPQGSSSQQGATFDVVHTHQVLQHVPDTVGALRAMAGACRSGGLVAARDSDYGSMRWWPEDARLDAWLRLYQLAAVANGGHPDAGRRLMRWAHDAGLRDLTPSGSVWCFATPGERAWWGALWAERMTTSAIATQAVAAGLATTADLEDIAAAWRDWAAHPDGWFAVTHGEIIARP